MPQVVGVEPAFKLSDAVTLFMQASESVHNLWNFYMVASFAAAGFAATTSGLTKRLAAIMTAGYCLFLAGHLSLLKQTIDVEATAAGALSNPTNLAAAGTFGSMIQDLTRTEDSWPISLAIHLAIDAATLGVIWYKAAQPPVSSL